MERYGARPARKTRELGTARSTVMKHGRGSDPASRVRLAFWIIALGIGIIHAWACRNAMNPDGVSYLDLADATMRGHWNAAVNAYWSPLYSWLLGVVLSILRPNARWEFAVAHLANVLSYVAALASFDFLLRQFIRYTRRSTSSTSSEKEATLPEWALMAIGLSLFIYFTAAYMTLRLVTPDTLVSAAVYLACGLLLRIRLGASSATTHAQLGLVLALGYLSKAAMFVLAPLFLMLAALATPRELGPGRRIRGAAVALGVFAIVSAPFIGAISAQKGRLTFGESGKMNYAWTVNGVHRFAHWRGDPPGYGTPTHPTQQICDNPPAYAFGSPVGGTYPPWCDPSYWYDGLRIRLELGKTARIVAANVGAYWQLIVKTQSFLLLGAMTLLVIGGRRAFVRDLSRHWILVVPAIAGLAMYSVVTRFSDPRYVGSFFVILWLALLGGIRFRPGRWRIRAGAVAAAAIAVGQLGFVPPGADTLYPPASVAITTAAMLEDAVRGTDRVADASAQVAADLRREGILPGDRVALIGDPFEEYWARLARVRIVAETPSVKRESTAAGERGFWDCTPADHAKVLDAFMKAGAKFALTAVPSRRKAEYLTQLGWRQIGTSRWHAFRFQE